MDNLKCVPNKIYKNAFYKNSKVPILKVKINYEFESLEINGIVCSSSKLFIKENNKYLIFEADDKEESLYQYIYCNDLDIKSILKITLRIGNIIQKINERGYILGSVDIEDFWIKDNNIDTIFLRQRNIFLTPKEFIKDYICSNINSMAVRREKAEEIDFICDLELYGKIFMKLMIPSRTINNYKELRYLAYNLVLFKDNIPINLYKWIDKVTSLYEEKRFSSINEAIQQLQLIYEDLNKENAISSEEYNFSFEYNAIKHPGKGKITKLSKQNIDNIEFINQDNVWIHKSDNKLFALVADGVSNCIYGNGYIASKLITDSCKVNVENKLKDINSNNIEDIFKNIINLSNENIVEYVKKDFKDCDLKNLDLDGIMASTFLGCFFDYDKVYYTSFGDSRLFLYREGNLVPLTIEDNLGNQKIKEDIQWDDYMELKHKSSLTSYIGDPYINENLKLEFLKCKSVKVKKDDLLILCSDGLTDYMYDLGSRKDMWNMNENIENILNENIEKNIAYINFKLVQKANFNGGWDNISSIIIKIK